MIKWEITLAELITIILTIIGGGFALYQWIQNSALKRATYYNEAYLKLRDDKDIVSVLYTIDYGIKKWYPFKSEDKDDFERKADKTFACLDYLCYLRKQRLIKEREFRNFEYEVIRIGFNSSSLDYLYNLYHFSKANGTQMSFSYLLDYLKQKKMIDDDFEDSKSKKYIHYLNF